MAPLYSRGWGGSSCVHCTRVAIVTVVRWLSEVFRDWLDRPHELIVSYLIQLEVWNADGWDKYFEPSISFSTFASLSEDQVKSLPVEMRKYQSRFHYSLHPAKRMMRKPYLIPLCSCEEIAAQASLQGKVFSKTDMRVPPTTAVPFPGQSFRGLSPSAADDKLLTITHRQSKQEDKLCYLRLGKLHQQGLLGSINMTQRGQRKWSQHFSGASDQTDTLLDSEWDGRRGVCTISW